MKNRREKDEIYFLPLPIKIPQKQASLRSNRVIEIPFTFHSWFQTPWKFLEMFFMECNTNSTLNGHAFTTRGRGKTSTHYFYRNHSFQKHSKVLSVSLKQQLYHSTICNPCSCALSRCLLGQNTCTYKTIPGSFSSPLILLAAKILRLFLRFITFYFFLVWIS